MMTDRTKQLVIVRGGGDIATGTIHRLHRCGYPVLILETGFPSAIRRCVAFSEAVYDGSAEVEGVACVKVSSYEEACSMMEQGVVPVMIDEQCQVLDKVRPWAVVDAILAKRNLGTSRDIHSPAKGIFLGKTMIGDMVEKGQLIGTVVTGQGEVAVEASLTGLLRGIIKDGFPVVKGFKIADIDPRKSEYENCFTISDKARCIAGSVVEGLMMLEMKQGH